MKLENLLLQKRAVILKRWFHLILETYPPQTAKFLKSQKDRFANPVGYAISCGIEGIFDQLCQGIDSDKASSFLDKIIRVRAIQDFSPSQAIAFIFLLKKVIRQELESEIRENGVSEELLALESRIDDLAFLSFDIYMQCREKLYEIKVNEIRTRTHRLLKRANMICDISEQESDHKDKEPLATLTV